MFEYNLRQQIADAVFGDDGVSVGAPADITKMIDSIVKVFTSNTVHLHELCWEQKPGASLACDRMRGHKGGHSYE